MDRSVSEKRESERNRVKQREKDIQRRQVTETDRKIERYT